MVEVFIGGSRNISTLPKTVIERLDNIIRQNFTVLVGDAMGADALVQQYLVGKSYLNTLVFCAGTCRHNAGGWKTIVVQPKGHENGFDFYALKDSAMAAEADYGFMVWDGRSNGTLNNVLNLLDRNKSTLVYFAPETSIYTVRGVEDIPVLLVKCGGKAIKLFEEKLRLSKRLSQMGLIVRHYRG